MDTGPSLPVSPFDSPMIHTGMPNTPQDQKRVMSGIGFGGVSSLLFIGMGYWASRTFGWFGSLTEREIMAIALIPPALSLFVGIGWAARTRHLVQNIDGSLPKPGSSLDITLRYIRNTTEQLLLFCVTVFCFQTAMPNLARTILPILGIWFLIARIMFWLGYRRSPTARATGFAATFYPTIFFFGLGLFALTAKIIS